VCTVTQNEDEGDIQDEHVEQGISGVFTAVRGHGGGAVVTAARSRSS
jgi:hypothetical protein